MEEKRSDASIQDYLAINVLSILGHFKILKNNH